ncbi:tRNA (adenine(58)-N(1))-methyltransferase, mitochondrial [Pholidichthys leucotaenia]
MAAHLASRLVAVCRNTCVLLKHGRTFSVSPPICGEAEGSGEDSSSSSSTTLISRLPSRRNRRPLSPLDRISGLLPPEALSPEVLQLRGEESSLQEAGGGVERGEEGGGGGGETELPQTSPETPQVPFPLPGENSLVCGELLIAEYKKKKVEFRKLFRLQKGGCLQSSWGIVLHDNINGCPPGQFLKTHLGVPLFIRRPSLEDYVLNMKRGPTIAYPKDAAFMMMMMDVTEGDSVLESGSGSGAMSLFLSRAVGCRGSVLSVEVREDHHRQAVSNYNCWRASWRLRRGEDWPDNVCFHRANLSTASDILIGRSFNSVCLDLVNPQLVLPTVVPHLNPGAVCAVYLANITQVIDLLEGLRCRMLPLICERIVEVPLRDWLVAPAVQKDGRYCKRRIQVGDEDDETLEESNEVETTAEDDVEFGSVPYIARPHPEQKSHTAFLVKLRRFVR